MAVVFTNTRGTYDPVTTDVDTRNRILQRMDRNRGVPIDIPKEYPDRGNTLLKKVLCYVNAPTGNPLITEDSSLTAKATIDDLAVILCFYGSDPSRLEVARKCLDELLTMNPQPKVIGLMEGSLDGKYRLDETGFYPNVLYQHIDCSDPNHRNFFLKEPLWNTAAASVLSVYPEIKKLLFLDIDTVYVDKMSLAEISRALDVYDVISPMGHCFYTGDSHEAKAYKLMQSTGQKAMTKSKHSGWQGFGLGMTAEFFHYIHDELPTCSVGFGDCLFWWLLLYKDVMRNFPLIPYNRSLLSQYVYGSDIKVGAPNTILQHLDHGPVSDRQYKVKCRLVQRAISQPFGDLSRVGSTHMMEWADTEEVNNLRVCLENLVIGNRKEVKLSTEQDADELFDYVMGFTCCPPRKYGRDPFNPHANAMPLARVARPGMDNRSML